MVGRNATDSPLAIVCSGVVLAILRWAPRVVGVFALPKCRIREHLEPRKVTNVLEDNSSHRREDVRKSARGSITEIEMMCNESV